MRESELLGTIGNLVAKCAPSGWRTVWLESTVEDGTGVTTFDWVGGSGGRRWFAPPNDDQYQIWRAFEELCAVMASRPPHKKWLKAMFTLEANGKLHTEFLYPNH